MEIDSLHLDVYVCSKCEMSSEDTEGQRENSGNLAREKIDKESTHTLALFIIFCTLRYK